ncbi:MAG: hypothetical protein V3V21_00700, partial [Thermoplasmata archaeon]
MENAEIETEQESPRKTRKVVDWTIKTVCILFVSFVFSVLTAIFLRYIGIDNYWLSFVITLIVVAAFFMLTLKREKEGPKKPSPRRKKLNDLLICASIILLLATGFLVIVGIIDMVPSMM